MGRGSTVQANSVAKVLDAARAAALDVPALLAAVGLAQADLDSPDARVPYAALAALYEHAARLTGDEAFGLRVGANSSAGMFDVLGQAVMSCEDLEHAFQTITRYLRVLQDGAVVRIDRDGGLARASYQVTDPTAGPHRHETEATIGILFRFLDDTLGGGFTPHRVELAHAAPADPSAHAAILRGPVAFDRPGDAIVFDAALLAHPMPRANAALSAILERHIRDMLARLPQTSGLTGDVRASIARLLERGEPAIGTVARGLGMSGRTLQRRLRDEATSFADLLDQVRHDLALRYLADPRRAVSEAAFLLGYAELSTFHRAFRRWTGITPGEWRRRR